MKTLDQIIAEGDAAIASAEARIHRLKIQERLALGACFLSAFCFGISLGMVIYA